MAHNPCLKLYEIMKKQKVGLAGYTGSGRTAVLSRAGLKQTGATFTFSKP